LTVSNWSASAGSPVNLTLATGGNRSNTATPANTGNGGSSAIGANNNFGWAGGSGLFILRTKS
jgi:hypothetical protein